MDSKLDSIEFDIECGIECRIECGIECGIEYGIECGIECGSEYDCCVVQKQILLISYSFREKLINRKME